jgi:hypothetical protein
MVRIALLGLGAQPASPPVNEAAQLTTFNHQEKGSLSGNARTPDGCGTLCGTLAKWRLAKSLIMMPDS